MHLAECGQGRLWPGEAAEVDSAHVRSHMHAQRQPDSDIGESWACAPCCAVQGARAMQKGRRA